MHTVAFHVTATMTAILGDNLSIDSDGVGFLIRNVLASRHVEILDLGSDLGNDFRSETMLGLRVVGTSR